MGSIIYGVEKKKGFITITGEVGVGKTTILRSYLEKIIRQQLKIVYVFNSNVSFKGLLKTIHRELGIDSKTDDIFEMINHLQQVLIEEYKQGRNVVLIVDEAQNMPVETQENLRMLSNLETSTDKLIQIVMVGQPEFENLLNLKELRQLKQRIAVRAVISPLTHEESMAYIQHRLTKVTNNGMQIFTRGALKLIVNKAKGTPRVLNILCDNALISGYGCQKKPVTYKIVKEIISDFEGRKRVLLFRWGVVTLLILIILLTGFIWVYPNKTFTLSQLKNYAYFQATPSSRARDEFEYSTEKPTLKLTKNTIPASKITPNTKNEKIIVAEGVSTTKEVGPGELTKSNKNLFNSEQLLNDETPEVTKTANAEENKTESLINKLENEKNELEKLMIKYQKKSQVNNDKN